MFLSYTNYSVKSLNADNKTTNTCMQTPQPNKQVGDYEMKPSEKKRFKT